MLAPMPNASVATAMAANDAFLRSARAAYRISCRSDSIIDVSSEYGSWYDAIVRVGGDVSDARASRRVLACDERAEARAAPRERQRRAARSARATRLGVERVVDVTELAASLAAKAAGSSRAAAARNARDVSVAGAAVRSGVIASPSAAACAERAEESLVTRHGGEPLEALCFGRAAARPSHVIR